MQEDTQDPQEATEIQTVDELMQRITEAYDALPRQLKSVATYIEQHRSNVMMDRTGDIAAACGVHPSAVVRFAQRFGFSGFSDLQAIFKQAYTGQSGSAQSYQQRIRKLIDEKPGKLSGGSVAREFIAASQRGLAELEAGLDDVQFEAAVNVSGGELYRLRAAAHGQARASGVGFRRHVSRADPQREEGRRGGRDQLRAVRQGDAVLRARSTASRRQDAGYYRRPAFAARASRERAFVREGRQRVCVPFAHEHDLPVPGAIYRACVPA